MDIKEKIQLGENRYVNAVNEDTSLKVNITASRTTLLEYDISNVLNISRLFDIERQATDIYRFHGEIEYLSCLTTLPLNYTAVTDFFNQTNKTVTKKSIGNGQWDFYLCKYVPPEGYLLANTGNTSDGYVNLVDDTYRADFEVLTKLTDCEIHKTGFALNVFNDIQYAYIFNKDIDLSSQVDGFGYPITDIFLHAVYVVQENGEGDEEVIRIKNYDSTGGTSGSSVYTNIQYNIGDVITGNILEYDNNNFTYSLINEMEYEIATYYDNGVNELRWTYKPFIPITLRVYEDTLRKANTGSTSNDDLLSIPSYANSIDSEGNVVWKNLLDKGFIDPLTEEGVNYPFINNKNYVFSNIIIDVFPNLNHTNTATVFSELNFESTSFVAAKPRNLNIGEKC